MNEVCLIKELKTKMTYDETQIFIAPLVDSIKRAGKPISNHSISYVRGDNLVHLGNDPISPSLKIPVD